MLSWIAETPRSYDDVMEIWRTSCLQLTVWEDAVDRGFSKQKRNGDDDTVVSVTEAGMRFLAG